MNLINEFLTSELNIPDSEEKLQLFTRYGNLILDWNKKINLISRKSTSIDDHILNSIFFLSKFPLKGDESIIDIGTGGGFPGIPLKILYPDLKLTLLDSIQKKTMVLEDMTKALDMGSVNVLTGRAEDLSNTQELKYKFDIVISKAVSSLSNLYSWGMSFLNENGKMICIKGGNIEEELSELTRRFKTVKTETIDYSFPSEYNIEDKKIVLISK